MSDLKELLSKIEKTVKEEIRDTPHYNKEDFIPYDTFGGNMDDAYWGGVEDGRTQLAEELLKLLKEKMSNKNFYNSDIGKKFGYLIHEHNSGTGIIRKYIYLLKKEMDKGTVSNGLLEKVIKGVNRGLEKQRKGVDYGYEEIKKILGYK